MVDDFWAKETAAADEEWADVRLTEQHTGDPMTCNLCVAGDGDARCQRCGHSVGMPGCSCLEGYLEGPCFA